MSLLDCGCGTGTITVGLAEIVTPAKAVGIDVSDAAIQQANRRETGNLRFEQASIHELPFDDDSFDAVFSHATLAMLKRPNEAVSEMKRVLKSGGVLGVRDSDDDGCIWEPEDGPMARWYELFEGVNFADGGDPRIGRKLKRLVSDAGFERLTIGGEYQVHGTNEEIRSFSDFAQALIGPDMAGPRIVEVGLAGKEELGELQTSIAKWAQDPGALAVYAWVHVAAWKP